ncbi:unnamed protein product [Tetraodon nigroviridis]|uniref:Chromosome 2 SCAF15004, whole genome shotgun sequence n=1 Tax=Tetraodon nigroviridis TaxID=99883 RepID=Q4RQL3_TETNG|nr:unnamed protein product [Tetraodon nigroviridis]
MAALAAQGAHLKPQRPFGPSVGPPRTPLLSPLVQREAAGCRNRHSPDLDKSRVPKVRDASIKFSRCFITME